jgi:hypothetical protein
VDIGNNASVNSGEDIDKDSSANNNFENNTYKLVFKGINRRIGNVQLIYYISRITYS